MYKKRYQRSRRRGPRRRGGGFRAKTFDPTNVVNNAPEPEEKNEYVLKHTFSDFDISGQIKSNIKARGFEDPTPIQDQAIPEILDGKDVVGVANTGTGKTAAFLIPLLNKVTRDKRQRVLIITPTRELAVQIEEELMSLTKGLNVYSAVIIGGVSIKGQIRKLQKHPQFVIGTPGRLLDLKNQRKINFNEFRSIVLDEVDRMLDMGFIHDIQKMINALPRQRQSLFFSATVGASVMDVMKKFTVNPVTISVKTQESAVNVDQEVIKVNGKPKLEMLKDLLDNREFEKVLVFGRTKRGADKLARELKRTGFQASTIHGNKSQNQRQRALNEFKDGRVNILVATDVVARGIDVEDITHVINYDLPESYENYLHRIGRTGRAGKKGKAFTFVG